ncbi:hypothetical protein ACEPAH_3512 [Sanghuangporus vaninii]
MASVDIDKAIEAAIGVVRDAHSQHKLQELSKAKVRHQVEQGLGLKGGTLSEKPYKKRINEAVDTTVEQVKAQKNANGKGQTDKKGHSGAAKPGSSAKKRKSTDTESTRTESKPASSRKTPSRNDDGVKDAKSKPASKPKSKGEQDQEKDASKEKAEEKKESADEAGPSSSGRRSDFKSKEVVLSDEEDQNEKRTYGSSASPSSSKKKGKRPIISDEAESNASPKRRRKSEDKAPKSNKNLDSKRTKIGNVDASLHIEEKVASDAQVQSDSELSVLIDEPPSKKKESKKAKKSKDGTEKKSRSKKESKETSPDEEQIKKLKSLVVACGVRKVWSKELRDCETPASQIAHLRNLLSSLGMRGRFSLEQAKLIKRKRDLEKEMADVQEFAQRYAEDRPKSSGQEPSVVDVSDEDKEENEIGETSRRPKNAHRSIMAFLGDQSDSE